MSRLLPFRTPVEREAGEPRVLGIDDDAADEVFAALSSRTAREILAALYEEPRTASDLAESVDTSLQNVRYHLDNLADAGLVEVADTWYSSRGTEMKVYAPADSSVVVFAGDESTGPTLREALGRLVGGIGVLALASLFVQGVFSPPTVGAGGGDAATTTTEDAGVTTTTDDAGVATTTDADTAYDRATTTAPQTTEEAATTTAEETPTETVAQTGTTAETTATQTETAVEATATTRQATNTTLATDANATTGSVTPTPEAVTTPETLRQATTRATTDTAATGGVDALSGLPPGALFFLGGAFALALAVGWWYWRG